MADTYQTFVGGGYSSDTTAGGPGGLMALYTTMNAVGAGDNTTNVATMLTHLKAIFGATGSNHNPNVTVIVDTTMITSVSRLRAILNDILAQASVSLKA